MKCHDAVLAAVDFGCWQHSWACHWLAAPVVNFKPCTSRTHAVHSTHPPMHCEESTMSAAALGACVNNVEEPMAKRMRAVFYLRTRGDRESVQHLARGMRV